MKRLIIAVTILAGLACICLGQYSSRVLPLKVIQLIKPRLKGPLSLEEALAKRRSVRHFTSRQLDLTQIGQLAWAGQGITEPQKGFRTAPSAGALYPMNLYFATQKGMFVYNPEEHSLEQSLNQDVRESLSTAALRQEPVAKAACDIIVAGSARKLAAKYDRKAKRYMLMEAGHIAQNIQLQAVSLELGSVTIGAFDISQVRKVCRLPRTLEPIYIICVGYAAEQDTTEKAKGQGRQMNGMRVKTAVLITAGENFRDEELFETRAVLTAATVETVIASSKTGVLKGMLGSRAKASILIDDIVIDDYDAIIFIGGAGAKEYFNNSVALNIAREAARKRKVLAAICIAPTVLANAGVLKGLAATSFPSERVKLQQAGARYTGAPVERDGLIITANGPAAAVPFARVIVEALAGR